MTKEELLARLSPWGQEHLLAFWDGLDGAARKRLADQIASVDFARVTRLRTGKAHEHDWAALAARAQPPRAFRLDANAAANQAAEAKALGEAALRTGRVGALLVAGGQGTRLGFDHPKGMFPLGPVSKRTLFQMHIDQLRAVGRRYGVKIPLYLMTSPATHDETVEYFRQHNRCGLDEGDVVIFCQGTMPAVDSQSGRLLLAGKDSLALSPDGHGGTLAALGSSGSLKDIQTRGIELLYYFQVDNPLVRICDPLFVGYHLVAGSEMSTQVVAKTSPLDRVGNVVFLDGRTAIIEYSDLPQSAAAKRNVDGSLYLWAGNIAVHMFDVDFLLRMQGREDALPFHLARKKVSYLDENGREQEPTTENAIKFEQFIFDLLPHTREAIVVEVDEAQIFAPVKNASGQKKDTPETSQAALMAVHRSWLRAAGAEVADEARVEINPLFALDAEELAAKVKPGTKIIDGTYLV